MRFQQPRMGGDRRFRARLLALRGRAWVGHAVRLAGLALVLLAAYNLLVAPYAGTPVWAPYRVLSDAPAARWTTYRALAGPAPARWLVIEDVLAIGVGAAVAWLA